MKNLLILPIFSLLLAALGQTAWAQDIYRCIAPGSNVPEYINNPKDAKSRNCSLMSGGNVTVVQSPLPFVKTPARTSSPVVSSNAGRPEASSDQRARDSDTRTILEAELRKSEARMLEQQKEYNNGEPEKQGIEGRNYQRYLERVAELKDNLARTQSDIASLKREIARLPVTN